MVKNKINESDIKQRKEFVNEIFKNKNIRYKSEIIEITITIEKD